MKKAFCFIILSLLAGCQTPNYPIVHFPGNEYRHILWTLEEQEKNVAVRQIYRSNDSSVHLMRLKGREFPHYHDKHDLQATIISGKSTIHFKDREVSLSPGDIIFIPKGSYHWVENKHPVATEIFAVFSPAFDGKDRRKVH